MRKIAERANTARSRDGSATEATIAKLEADISAEREAREKAEEALRETHAAMIKHQQVGRMGDFRYNTRTQESRGSLECYKLFGYDPQLDLIDFSTWTERIHPDDRPGIIKQLADAIADSAPILFEYRIELHGETRYIRCEGQPDHDHVGDLVYYGVLTDVTERKGNEERQRRMEAELASALRFASMGELAASIIHEVNQPLSAIATSAAACRRWITGGPERNGDALASLNRVIAESSRVAAVIAGMKSLIRQAEPALGPLDVEDTMREVASLATAMLARERVLLEPEFAPDLPAAWGDRVQIQQVVMNLIHNAIDAMHSVTRRRILTVGAAAEDDRVILFVADNGVGIAPEDLPKVFDALYTTKPGGMGLGLAISRKILAVHSGRLWAEANAGGGMTFKLSLPLAVHAKSA